MAGQAIWRKALVTTIICSMLAGGAAYAEETDTAAAGSDGAVTADSGSAEVAMSGEGSAGDSVSAVAADAAAESPFPDVKSGHWAMKHVAKLYYQGIVTGTPDGKFNPNANVTQQEAVLMALRFMGLHDSARSDAEIIFPPTFQVDNFFKKYILLALQQGLLDENEEFASAEADPETHWGMKPATREWVTKLVIRAIGEEQAGELPSGLPGFADAGLVDERYAGYVGLAVEMELVKGVTADRFDPKGVVTRAQMATFLSRAESKHAAVDYEGQAGGIMTALDASSVTLTGESGIAQSFAITPQTLVYRHDAETAIAAVALKPFTAAIVLAKDGKALYIEQMDDNERLERIDGTFESVDEGKIWLKVGSGFESIDYDRGLTVTDGSGAALTLDTLPEGSEVSVYRDTFRETKQAVRIEVKGSPVNKTGRGKVAAIAGNMLTIAEDGAAAGQAWTVSASATITRQGVQGTLSDLRIGDTVSFGIENNLVTSLVIESSGARTAAGTFDSFSADGKSIIYSAGGKLEVSPLAPYASLTIEGFAGATWSDLNKEDALELSLNGSDQVTAVKVTNRNIKTLPFAVIESYRDASKVLTVLDDKGNPLAFKLSDKTRIEWNGTALGLQAATSQLTQNRKITVVYSDSTIVAIKFSLQHTGKLLSLNTVAANAVVQLQDGSTITVPYLTPAPAVELIGKTNATLADVKAGDTVTLQLDSNQDKAVMIKVHRVLQQTIVSVDIAKRKMKLASADGSTVEYDVPSDATLSSASGQTLTLSQHAAGQTVNVTFAGKTITAIKAVEFKTGKVVSAVPGTVTIRDYAGSVSDISLGTAFKVVKNGVASTSASVLAEGDRVSVGKNENDETVITVLAGITRTFWRYDAATGEINVYSTSINDTNVKFKVYADTVIASASGEPLTVASLKSNNKIVLYLLNGKLLEVVKQ